MTTPQNRQPEGIPAGGQFAATAHAEPEATLHHTDTRFAGIDDVRELDSAASAALNPLLTPDATDQDQAAAKQVRDEWMVRRHQIFAVNRRRDADAYAARLEAEAHELLHKAARANLRSIADGLREKHPNAASMTLGRDYDDGSLAIYVESVRDKDGNELRDPEQDPCDTAQELVSEYSSRQLNRFVDDGPIDLVAASAWTPDRRTPFLR